MRILAIIFFVLFLSCGTKPTNQEIKVEDQLTFQTQTLEKESCVGGDCATLKLSWPVASGTKASEKINQAIDNQISFLVQTGETNGPLDTMVVEYMRSFEAFKKEFPDSYGGWEIEANAEISYLSDSTLSIYFTQFSFLGGAHPNSVVSFLNFDPKTGFAMSDDELVLDKAALLTLAENKFRANYEVEKDDNLSEDGRFFLPETGFFLADAIGFKEGKFWVIYIPYEIGPYSLGYTELEFTKEELAGIVRW